MAAPSAGDAPLTPLNDRSWTKRVSDVCDDYCRDTSIHCLRYLSSQQEHPVPVSETSNNNKKSDVMKATAKDYCKETSLDGFKYVAEERPLAERILWAIAILLSLIGCAIPVYEIWNKWMTAPVIVTFADNTESTRALPFPTVTVCPMVKYRPQAVDFREALRQESVSPLPEELKAKVDAVKLLCTYNIDNSTQDTDYINETSIEIMKKVAPSLWDTIDCSGVDGCEAYMSTVLTEEGVCYSFNALPNSELYNKFVISNGNALDETQTSPIWTLEDGYKDTSPTMGGKPLRGVTVGFNRGVVLILSVNTSEVDLRCRPFRGFRVTLSNPAEGPQQQSVHYYLPESGVTQMALIPKVMDTDLELRRYSVKDRHCVYPDERRLRHFTTYTQGNCRLECLVNATLQNCSCVQFYMPRDENTPICGLAKKECATDVEDQVMLSLDGRGDSCRCPPPCKSIDYSVEVTQSAMDVQEILRAQIRDPKISEMYRNLTSNYVVIYLKESEFIASRRSELYGYGSFMAEVGGLLGLWNGFSILSLVELIYFFTIRLWHDTRDLRVPKKLERKQQEEQDNAKSVKKEKDDSPIILVNEHVP